MFEKIAVLGLGLIGSSICRGVKAQGLAKTITGHAKSVQTRKAALEIGLVQQVFENPADAVKDADLVILCVPIGVCGALSEAISAHLKPGAILTDVGSVKGAVVRDCGPFVPNGVHFIPGHPIAGTEQSGPHSGFAELFHGRWCILTPIPGSEPEAVSRLTHFWEALGSMVTVMEVAQHDMVLAITSHLPHLIAFTIVATADDLENVTKSDVIKYSASGFRDFTRIAASDPTMWRDVFLNNRDAVLEMLGRFSEELAAMQHAVRWGDGEALFEFFTRARLVRRSITPAGQNTAATDSGPGPV